LVDEGHNEPAQQGPPVTPHTSHNMVERLQAKGAAHHWPPTPLQHGWPPPPQPRHRPPIARV
jgi:hypothetical protein